MNIIRFKARDLKPYGEYVKSSGLVQGETYFAVHFLDDQMLVPELDPLVFIGRNLEPGFSGCSLLHEWHPIRKQGRS